MKPEQIRSDAAPAAIGPYAQAVRAGGFVFVSGQIPLDPASGELVGGGIESQAEQAMANLGRVLEAAGLGYEAVVKTTIYLADMADFPAVNKVYGSFFKENLPARATVAVAGLPKEAQVEIDAVAWAGE